MNKIRIAVAGASGRMGRMLVESTLKASDTAMLRIEDTDALFGDDGVVVPVVGPDVAPSVAGGRRLASQSRIPVERHRRE